MKSIPLRRLLREPAQVKRWTRAGETVLITDASVPLWLVQPAACREIDPARDSAIDEVLEETLDAPRSTISAASLLDESRR